VFFKAPQIESRLLYFLWWMSLLGLCFCRKLRNSAWLIPSTVSPHKPPSRGLDRGADLLTRACQNEWRRQTSLPAASKRMGSGKEGKEVLPCRPWLGPPATAARKVQPQMRADLVCWGLDSRLGWTGWAQRNRDQGKEPIRKWLISLMDCFEIRAIFRRSTGAIPQHIYTLCASSYYKSSTGKWQSYVWSY
jgi:hypothetical protein